MHVSKKSFPYSKVRVWQPKNLLNYYQENPSVQDKSQKATF